MTLAELMADLADRLELDDRLIEGELLAPGQPTRTQREAATRARTREADNARRRRYREARQTHQENAA